MSTTTDNKIVEMRFDNQQFEKNANTSISTLEKLKNALKFDRSSVRDLENFQKSTKDFNLDHMSQSVDKVSDHFSALGVAGMTVINRLTNAAIDFGKKAVGAMTGGLNSGFSKYSAKTDAVQVMMINSGESIEYVNGLMDELQNYVDETSYSFEQMTRTMGNFAAVGLDLENAEEMVEGIANWAATAGVNAVKAEAAFNEVSSAISKQALDLRDAQTLLRLNMFTPDFRRLAIVTAEAMGTIKKESDRYWVDIGTGAKENWVELTEENLTSTLRGKWFTNDVWDEVMHLYASTNADYLDDLDRELLEAAGLTEDFGLAAYNAAYEAKTFSDALGAIRDTISTGWAITFENIFGNYEEASWFWTDFATEVQNIVGALGDLRNEFWGAWNEMGGQISLGRSILNGLKLIEGYLDPILVAFKEVFNTFTPDSLYKITEAINEFFLSLRPFTDEDWETIEYTFEVIFGAIKELEEPLKLIVSAFRDFIGVILKISAVLASFVGNTLLMVSYSGILYDIVYNIIEALRTVGYTILGVIVLIVRFVNSINLLEIVPTIIGSVEYAFTILAGTVIGVVSIIVNYITQLVAKIIELRDSGINVFLYAFNTVLGFLTDTFEKLKKNVVDTFNRIKEGVKSAFEAVKGLKLMTSAQDALNKVVSKFDGASTIFTNVTTSITNFADTVVNKLGSAVNAFKEFFSSLTAGKIAIAGAVAGLGALAVKSIFFSSKEAVGGIGALGGGPGGLLSLLFNAKGIAKTVALVGALGGATALLYKVISKGKEAGGGDGVGIIERFLGVFKGKKDEAKTGEESVGLFTKIGDAVKGFGVAVKNFLQPAIDTLKHFFETINWGQVIVAGFFATIASSFVIFITSIASIPALMFSLTNTFMALGNAIRSWSIWGVDTFGDTTIKIGQSLMYLAGAMWIISKVPAERFTEVTNAVKYFMNTMLAITGMSAVLSIFGKLENVWDLGVTLLSLSVALMAIAGAVKIIDSTNPKSLLISMLGVIGTLVSLMAIMTGFSALLAKFAPVVAKCTLSLKSFAFTIAVLSLALLAISYIPAERLEPATNALKWILLAYSALIAALGLVAGKAKGALVSCFALISLAMAFKIMVETMMAIGESGLGGEHFVANWQAYLEVFAVLSTFCLLAVGVSKLLKAAGKDMAGAGVAILAIALSMALIVRTISYLSMIKDKIDWAAFGKLSLAIIAIGAGLGLALWGLSTLGPAAAKASLALLSVSFAFITLAGLGFLISLIPMQENMYWKALGAMLALSAFVSAILAASYLAKKVRWQPIMAMVALIGVLALAFVGIAQFGGEVSTISSIAGAMFITLFGIAINFGVLAGVTKAIKFSSILGMAGILVAIGGALYLAAQQPWKEIREASIELNATLWSLTLAFAVLSALTKGNELGSLIATGAFFGMALSLTVLVQVLKDLSEIKFAEIEEGGKALGIISAALIILSGIFGAAPEVFGFGLAIILAGLLALSLIMDPLTKGLTVVTEAFGNFSIKLAKAAEIVASGIAKIVSAFGTIVKDVLSVKVLLIDALTGLIEKFVWAFQTVTELIPQFAENLANGFVTIAAGIGTGIATMFVTLVAGLRQGFKYLEDEFKKEHPILYAAADTLFNQVPASAAGAFPQVSRIAEEGFGKVTDWIRTKGVEDMANATEEVGDAITTGFAAKETAAEEASKSLGQAIKDGLFNFLGIGTAGYIDGSHGYGSGAVVPASVQAFVDGAASNYGALYGAGEDFGNPFGEGVFESVTSWATDAFNNAMSILGALPDIGKGILDFGKEVVSPHVTPPEEKWMEAYYGKNYYKMTEEEMAKYREQKTKNAAAANKAELDNEKATLEEFQEMERNLAQRKALGSWDFFTKPNRGNRTRGGGAGGGAAGGGGGGGGGGGAAEAKEEAVDLFDLWEDGGRIIQKVAQRFNDAYNVLGYTHPIQMGEAAVQSLADTLYEVYKDEDFDTLEDKLAFMQEVFNKTISDIDENLINFGDQFGNFTQNLAVPIKDWMKNLDAQENALEAWITHIEQLTKRGASFDLVDQFIKLGPEDDATLLDLLSQSDDTFDNFSKKLEKYRDKENKKFFDNEERLAASLSMAALNDTKKASGEVTSTIEQATDENSEKIKKKAEEIASKISDISEESTKSYVTVNRNGVASVINETSKITKANDEVAKSTFKLADVSRQALFKVEQAYKSTKQAVLDSVQGSINILDKFDTETEMDKEELIDNAHDSLKAWQQMYDGMGELARKGLDTDFIRDVLVPMNESAYPYVQAFLDMTESELDQFSSMYKQAQSLPEDLASGLARDVGEYTMFATQGIMTALSDPAIYETARESVKPVLDALIDGINNGEDGVEAAMTLVTAATVEAGVDSLSQNFNQITSEGAQQFSNTFDEWKTDASSGMYSTLQYAIDGAVQSIKDNFYKVKEAMREGDQSLIQSTMDDFEENSPSKVFMRIGKYLDLGLANGITDYAGTIMDAATDTSNSAINSMRAVVGHISDIINGEVQVDPTIRPIVDLSGVEAGASAIDAMFGGTSYDMTRGMNIQNANASLNDMMAQYMAAQTMAGPVNPNGSPINIYVYATPSQSEEEIANIVEQKLMFRINRQGGVWR